MLLSRFWYIFLAVAATTGLAAAILAQGILNDQHDAALETALRRDRAALDVQLALEARSRLDRIAFITVDRGFGALLNQASRADDLSQMRSAGLELKTAMQSHVQQLQQAKQPAPDVAFAVDRRGRIVAQLGPLSRNPPGGSLETYPLVQRVLQGYVRDDVWLYDRKVYRMAGRPVMHGSQYAGAILHGHRFDNRLAKQLAKNLKGATVGFFVGNELVAGFAPSDETATALTSLEGSLPGVLEDAQLLEDGRTGPWRVSEGDRAMYALLPGSTVNAQVGVVVGRPRVTLGDPLALFDSASQQDINNLPIVQLAFFGLLAVGLGFFFMWLEHDRPFNNLRLRVEQILAGEQERLISTDWSGGYRVIADHINHVIEQASSKPGLGRRNKKRKANLDEILGPTPGESGAQPFFGFAADPNEPSGPVDDDPFMFATAQTTGETGVLDSIPPPLAPASPPGPPPRESQVDPQPPPAAIPNGVPINGVAGAPGRLSSASPPPPPAASSLSSMLPPAPRPSNPGAGAVTAAAVPQDNQVSEITEEDLAHYRQVFDEYVATRQECGEPIENLTYQRFELSLEKTRTQLLSRHQAKRVKFTVYVKDGKAALKAAAVRS